jgi:hypothetical protein
VPQAVKVLVPPESLNNRKLPFVSKEEPPEPEQLRLIPPRDGVADELEELSRRVKARVEGLVSSVRMRRRLEKEDRKEERRRRTKMRKREREEKRQARQATKTMRMDMRDLNKNSR